MFRDDDHLRALLASLKNQSWPGTWVVVDGDDSDATQEVALSGGARYVRSSPGRGYQIARGLHDAEPWVLILHADSGVQLDMRRALQELMQGEPCWGRFDVRIPGLSVVAKSMNLRSRVTKICTGDQGMFFHQSLLSEFPNLPLMEDIELSRRLKKAHGKRFLPCKERISTSARRWQKEGVIRTILRMWLFRLRYFFGASAQQLYTEYYHRE